MDNNFVAKAEININASKAKVWDALINPVMIKKYFFGTDCTSDWKAGSKISFRGVWDGKEYEDKGNILKIEPEKYLEYNYWSSFSGTQDVPENYAIVTYSLSNESGFTKLTITQDSVPNEDSKKHSEENWKMVLEGLKKLLEE
jgi:uncharacterized protein YndB with AHSA1/START domain